MGRLSNTPLPLKTVTITKGLKLSPILYLAPLHGVTGHIYRNVYYRHFSGIDYVIAPFVSSLSSEKVYAKGRGNHFKDLLPKNNPHFKLIPQILGNQASSFVQTAKAIQNLGYSEVNLNMGCPFQIVTKKKRGSGFLPHPDLIRPFLDEVCAQLTMEFSIKVRLGLSDPMELIHLMPLFNDYPLKKIIIHPRIGHQMYTGEVDLDLFEEAVGLSSHEIMYNGDIKNLATFEMLQARFPHIKEWMVGRWAIFNPFLPSLLKGEALPDDPLRAVRSFHDDLNAAYKEILFGPKHVLDKMKEIWTYLGKSFAEVDGPRQNIIRAKTSDEYDRAVDAVFAQGQWRPELMG